RRCRFAHQKSYGRSSGPTSPSPFSLSPDRGSRQPRLPRFPPQRGEPVSGRKAKQARRVHRTVPTGRRHWLTERRVAYIAATVAIVVAVVGGFAIAHKRNSAASSAPLSGAVSDASGDAPSLQGRDPITGGEVSLAQFAGRPVVLNVWASWCTGC